MKLTEIIGIEEKHARLLEKAGIKEVEDLLTLSYYQIKKLARSIGVTVKALDTWQEHADLMRIQGVSPELANAINLPFENNSVDFLVSTGSFHHWKHPFKIFNECYRILKPGCEAWIYDGCYNPPYEEVLKLKRKYGSFQYQIVTRIQKLHGFNWEIYNTKIKRLLEHTKFKSNFQMILTNGWMKIILKK